MAENEVAILRRVISHLRDRIGMYETGDDFERGCDFAYRDAIETIEGAYPELKEAIK